ncbi:MAG: polysaccharide biosynthesis/export family protein [Syntrophobacteraceae bacterium]|jgi:polysaccharide export outer membrane protein
MKLRPDFLLFVSLLVFISGCAGSQWDQRMVEGSTGPVTEIRAGRYPATPVAQVVNAPDPQARQAQLQERLLKMSAALPMKSFQDYTVGPEDALQVTFLDSDKLSALARVNGQGEIRMLLVGNVKVAGLTPTGIAQKLTGLYRDEGYLTNPQIMVTVQEYRNQRVAVSGAVNKPDYYPLIGPRTLMEVLGMAGGLSTAAGDVVHIMRPREASQDSAQAPQQQGFNGDTIVVDLTRLLLKDEVELNVQIRNGDVVFVPFARSAYVIGSVTKPGNVLLQDNMTVTRAITQSQGQQIQLASDYVTVLRVDDKGQRQIIPLDLGQVLKGHQEDIALQPNDIVYVHESKVRRFLYDFKMLLPGSVGMSMGGAL